MAEGLNIGGYGGYVVVSGRLDMENSWVANGDTHPLES